MREPDLPVVAQVPDLVRVQERQVEAHAARGQPLQRLARRAHHDVHLRTNLLELLFDEGVPALRQHVFASVGRVIIET